jgi:hypothetical protein
MRLLKSHEKPDTGLSGRPTVLRSTVCAYCGVVFGSGVSRTIDHVVGRKFVPKHKLSGQWNLHVYACKKCNGEKSDLEDDISVISMLGGPNGVGPTDPVLIAEIARKARRSISRRTRKPVAESAEEFFLEREMHGATMRFGFVAPAQVQTQRIGVLAWFHIQAFAFLTSYDESEQTGRFLQEEFHLLASSSEVDWGSKRLRWFCDTTKGWTPVLRADIADAYFKIVLRRYGDERLWSWALEWNCSMRVAGLYGDSRLIESFVCQIPDAASAFVHEQGNEIFVARQSIPITTDEDMLFSWDDFDSLDDSSQAEMSNA